MKVFLQDKRTLQFLRENGDWTAQIEAAMPFPNTLRAWSYCSEQHLRDAQVILSFPQREYDICIPCQRGEIENFKVADDYAEYHVSGQLSLDDAVEFIRTAIISTRERNIRNLLVNAVGVTTDIVLGVAERYFIMNEIVRAAQRKVRIAIVLRPEHIHPEKFGIDVATRAGLVVDVFPTDEEGLRWLKSLP